MESRAKLLGHPIHQMLIVVPMGTFTATALFDALNFFSPDPRWGLVAFWSLAVGVFSGALASAFGLADFLAIPSHTRAKRVGAAHGIGNAIALVLMFQSLVARIGNPEDPPRAALAIALAAYALTIVTGWLGGELVDRLAVGVDDGAGLDAPSSLKGPSL